MTAALILAKFVGRWLLDRWPYVLGAVIAVAGLWALYSAIYDAGAASVQKKWDDAQRAAEAKAAADTIQLQDAMAGVDTGITIDLEAIANVRTIYRDKVRTIAVDAYRGSAACDVPGRLLEQINAAASGYASAAAGASGSAVRPAQPSH